MRINTLEDLINLLKPYVGRSSLRGDKVERVLEILESVDPDDPLLFNIIGASNYRSGSRMTAYIIRKVLETEDRFGFERRSEVTQ